MKELRKIGLLLLIVATFIACKGQENQITDKECKCEKIVKEYAYFEQTIVVEKYYYFSPEKAVTFYADGTNTTPPINKHVKRMLHCIPSVKLKPPTLQLDYVIKEKELLEWGVWLKEHCKDSFEKYQVEKDKKK